MKQPAMKLTMVVESTQDKNLTPRLIPLLACKSLADIIEDPLVAPLIPPLLERHERSIDIMKQRSDCKQGTIFFDLMDYELEGYNKFVPYYLHPDSTYSVGLSKSSFRTKVSVGSNPWTTMRPQDMGGMRGLGPSPLSRIRKITPVKLRTRLSKSYAPAWRRWSS